MTPRRKPKTARDTGGVGSCVTSALTGAPIAWLVLDDRRWGGMIQLNGVAISLTTAEDLADWLQRAVANDPSRQRGGSKTRKGVGK